jgi:entericidin A
MRALIGILAAMFFLTSCETVKGVGRDIESIGEAGEDVID